MAPKFSFLLPVVFVFFLFSVALISGQKQSKKKEQHYFGVYIGDFQDRFHGIAGQVNNNKTNFFKNGSFPVTFFFILSFQLIH